MLNIKVVTWTMGIFTSISFIVCVIYGLVVPRSLHMYQLLEMALPVRHTDIISLFRPLESAVNCSNLSGG